MLRRIRGSLIVRTQASKASKAGNGASAAATGIDATQPHSHDCPQEEVDEPRSGSEPPQNMIHNEPSEFSDSSNGSALERAVATGCAAANCAVSSSSDFPSAHQPRLCWYCQKSQIPEGFAQCDMCAYIHITQVRADKSHAAWPCRACESFYALDCILARLCDCCLLSLKYSALCDFNQFIAVLQTW